MNRKKEERKKEKKMPFIVVTYVSAAAKGSACTPLGPILNHSELDIKACK
jgi:hypothetical protein